MSIDASSKPSILQKLANRLFAGPAGSIFRGMATIAAGNLLGRVVGIIALPILTRLYGPESFGVLAVFTAMVAFLIPIATLRYAIAIPLPRTDAMAMNVLALAAAIIITLGTLMTLTLWLAAAPLFALFDMESVAPYWWLIVLGVLGGAVYELFSMWATRKRDYPLIARTHILQAVSGALTKLAFGFFSPAPSGLMAGQILNQSGGIVSLAKRFYADAKRNLGQISRKRMELVAGIYVGLPKFRLPSQFILIFSQQAPLLFVASFYGMAVAGQLAIAKTLVTLPINLLSGSLTKAAYGEIASIKRDKPQQIKQILKTLVAKLFLLAAAASALVFFLAPPLVPAILGGQWQQAGQFASYLAIYIVAAIIAVPMTAFVNVFNRQGEFLAWNSTRAILVGTLMAIVAYLEMSALSFVLWYSITMLVFQSGVVFRTRRIVNQEVGQR